MADTYECPGCGEDFTECRCKEKATLAAARAALAGLGTKHGVCGCTSCRNEMCGAFHTLRRVLESALERNVLTPDELAVLAGIPKET